MKYAQLCSVYEKLEATTKRLEKTEHIAELLSKTSIEELERVVLLLQGKVFVPWDKREIGMAAKLVLKAISKTTGNTTESIEEQWAKHGDIGTVASKLCEKKKQKTLFSKDLSVKKVFDNLRKLASLEGSGSVGRKVGLVAELLSCATPSEAKFIVRSVLQELRVGVAEGTLRDAIVRAYLPRVRGINCNNMQGRTLAVKSLEELKKADLSKYEFIEFSDDKDKKISRECYNYLVDSVQEAYNMANDFSSVAQKLKKDGLKALKSINLEPGRPVKVMLAQKVADIKEGFDCVSLPAQAEYKYDGFRMQIHMNEKGCITLFTRRLEDVTKQFPEVAENVKKNVKGKSFILDAEAVSFNRQNGRYLPFQAVSQRIKRKYDIASVAREIPVEVNVFDVICYNGKNLLKESFKTRRELIEKIISPVEKQLVVAKAMVSSDEKKVEEFYKQALKIGNEGIMLKSLKAPYKPGSRVGHMVKLKPVMDTLDLVITGAEWGEGKRGKWLSSFTVACVDEEGELLEMGKVGTGIKEKEDEAGSVTFEQLTELLRPLITFEKGKEVVVRPELVVEIKYEEIQKSPTYNSGFALRFPRLVVARPDRTIEDVSSLATVETLFKGQFKR